MFESKYNKFLTTILIVVIVAIIGLLGYFAYTYFSAQNSTKEAEEFVGNYTGDDDSDSDGEDNANNDGSNPLDEIKEADTSNGRTKKKMYKGFVVNGTMSIPKINFNYPVLEKETKKSIETAVAIRYGVGLNKVGNTVIAGHNYRNGQFFSNLKKLSVGDKINVTDYEGNKLTYTIYNKFETTPEDASFYQRDTNGKPEVTLTTCTDDSSARLIIFAKAD